MRKVIPACLAIVFLTMPLHAQSVGSDALKGGAKGAGAGGGANQSVPPIDRMKSANKNMDQTRALLIKPTTPKPNTMGSSQTKGQQ